MNHPLLIMRNYPICPDCQTNKNVIEDFRGGFTVCSRCGVVVGLVLDEGPEKHHIEEQEQRTGYQSFYSSLHDDLLFGTIGVKTIKKAPKFDKNHLVFDHLQQFIGISRVLFNF